VTGSAMKEDSPLGMWWSIQDTIALCTPPQRL
jgi:hypothetical protein